MIDAARNEVVENDIGDRRSIGIGIDVVHTGVAGRIPRGVGHHCNCLPIHLHGHGASEHLAPDHIVLRRRLPAQIKVSWAQIVWPQAPYAVMVIRGKVLRVPTARNIRFGRSGNRIGT